MVKKIFLVFYQCTLTTRGIPFIIIVQEETLERMKTFLLCRVGQKIRGDNVMKNVIC